MLTFLTRLKTAAYYPAAFTIISAQSAMARVKTMGKAPVVHFEAPYDGQRIMLLALYEKGALRPDVLRLLRAARAEGLYILAINTLKLRDPLALKDLIDCYIERPNFGRDFGSYQTGFLHVFQRGWHQTCPRLLMINDSIFFTEERMPKFLNDMMTSDIEVLGSTENYDIEYHLGSFCIAISGSVLRNGNFSKYWKSYRLTDVRPKVIKRGELKLSKVLKRCVAAPDTFSALYGATRYSDTISSDPEMVQFALDNVRSSKIFAWKRASLKNVAQEYRDRYGISRIDIEAKNTSVEVTSTELIDEVQVSNTDELTQYLRARLNTEDISHSTAQIMVKSELMESFMSGSQIHQNACIMLRMGLPIVKNDGLYRGIFSFEDIERISNLLRPEEAGELRAVLISRPYGGRYLTGWKKAAFESGLI